MMTSPINKYLMTKICFKKRRKEKQEDPFDA